MHRPAPVRNFSLRKEWGPQRKISMVDMVFLVFIGLLRLPPAWEACL